MTKGKRRRLRDRAEVAPATRPTTPPRGRTADGAGAGDGANATPDAAAAPRSTRGDATARARTARTARSSGPRRSAAAAPRQPAEATASSEPLQQPPALVSLVRGMTTFGRSPIMLAVVFGGAVALWLAYSASGVVHFVSPGVMAQIEAVPPVHGVLDFFFVLAARQAFENTAYGLIAIVIAVRSLLVAYCVAYAVEAMTAEAGDPDVPRRALRRAIERLPLVFLLEVALVATVAILLSFLLRGFGPLGVVLAVVIPTYLLVFAPVVLVAERAGLSESIRLSVRAARLPGRSHLVLSTLYPMVSVVLILLTAGGPAVPATPSITVWSYALFLNFVHASVLAAFVYRWLQIRTEALKAPDPGTKRRWWTLAPG